MFGSTEDVGLQDGMECLYIRLLRITLSIELAVRVHEGVAIVKHV